MSQGLYSECGGRDLSRGIGSVTPRMVHTSSRFQSSKWVTNGIRAFVRGVVGKEYPSTAKMPLEGLLIRYTTEENVPVLLTESATR
jgi:hypothetical protein